MHFPELDFVSLFSLSALVRFMIFPQAVTKTAEVQMGANKTTIKI